MIPKLKGKSKSSKHKLKKEHKIDETSWLCPIEYKPKENEYLKLAFVKFKNNNPVYYYTLHR